MSADPPRRPRSPFDGSGGSCTCAPRRALGRLVAALALFLALGARAADGTSDTDTRSAGPGNESARATTNGPELEHGIKAAFLLNFIRYTTWPKDSFEGTETPIRVHVIGRDPFGKLLDDTLRGEKANGRPLEVVRTAQVPAEIRAHVVFCGELSRTERLELLQKCRKKPVLVVGELEGLAQEGACINFYLQDKKVRFEINVDTVADASLQISASVLKLAKIVKRKEAAR